MPHTINELQLAAIEIAKLNPKISLSGSLALRLQNNFYPDREVGDLDFELPYGIKLKTNSDLIEEEFDNDEYSDASHDLICATYKGISVNFFQARKAKDEITDTDWTYVSDGKEEVMMRVVHYTKILERKLFIVFSMDANEESQIKHANDLLFIINKQIEIIKPVKTIST